MSTIYHPLLSLLCIFTQFTSQIFGSVKFNQRTFLSIKAINYVDPTKDGFRVILRDEFLRDHLAPTLLPTLYLTAIPLAEDEPVVSKVLYPDSVNEEKQLSLHGLSESNWYYLCVEWENFNRQNETTGTDCRTYRTLDRMGKGSDTTIAEIEATDVSSQIFQFLLRVQVNFPIKITVSLEHGKVPLPAAQIFYLSENAELEVIFPFLRQQRNYGQLCITEEPQVTAHTAMGRLITGVRLRHKCHFDHLTTKDYELSILESAEASPYKRSANNSISSAQNNSNSLLLWITLIAFGLFLNFRAS